MALKEWQAVDDYLTATLLGDDPVLDAVLAANASAGLPAIDVTATQGALLTLLCRIAGARSVLEIGTLGGYSTIWCARGLPADGVVVTLEANPHHAAVARANLDRAGLAQQVEIKIGPALDTLPTLANHPAAPFDVVFIDADKPNNPGYLELSLRLSRPGTVIVCDNVIREGTVADADSDDPSTVGARRCLEMMGTDPRLDATTLQTVGSKGWDGFALALVR